MVSSCGPAVNNYNARCSPILTAGLGEDTFHAEGFLGRLSMEDQTVLTRKKRRCRPFSVVRGLTRCGSVVDDGGN